MLWSRSEEPKLNCLPEPEPKLRIAAPAPAPFYLSKTEEILEEKIMVAEEVFVHCYNFNPIREKHASIHVKCTNTQVKKLIFKVFIPTIRSRGRRRSWSRSRNSYLRLRGAGAKRNIFGFTTLDKNSFKYKNRNTYISRPQRRTSKLQEKPPSLKRDPGTSIS